MNFPGNNKINLKKIEYFTRKDGRTNFEQRKINLKLNVIPSSISSFYLEFGSNKFLLSLFGPKFSINKKVHRCCNFKTIFLETPVNFKSFGKINLLVSSIINNVTLSNLFPNSKFFVLIRKIKNDGNWASLIIWASQILISLANIPCKFPIKFNSLCLIKQKFFIDPTSEEMFFTKTQLNIVSEDDFDCKALEIFGLDLKNLTIFENALGYIGNDSYNFIFSKMIPNKYSFFFF
jgi:ribonuclease PH